MINSLSLKPTQLSCFSFKEEKCISNTFICCIELINSNYIYINYNPSWTVKELIQSIINTKCFKQLYPHINTHYHLHFFDLYLAIYDSSNTTSINLSNDLKLEDLKAAGIVFNCNYPTFIFKENRPNLNYYTTGVYYHHFNEENSKESKKGLNKVIKYTLNPSIKEEQDKDWFIYDNESMNFLLNYELKRFAILSDIYFHNDTIYLEDYYQSSNITQEELSTFLVNLTYTPKTDVNYGTMTKKFKINRETSMNDLFGILNDKLNVMQSSTMFEAKSKILKVKSKCDYVFNLNVPLINYAYIKECIRNNTEARYIIIDNPFDADDDDNKNADDVDPDVNEMIDIYNSIALPKERRSTYKKYSINEDKERKSVIGDSIYYNKEMMIKANNAAININTIYNNNSNSNTLISPFIQNIIEEIQLNNNKNEANDKEDIYKDELIIDEDFDCNRNLNINSITNKVNILDSKKRASKGKKNKNFNSILMKVMPSNYYSAITQFSPSNIFKSNIGSIIDINALRKQNKKDISIHTLDKPFSLIIRSAYLKSNYNSLPPECNAYRSILLFTFQINAGKHKFSDAKRIKYETSSQEDQNPLFNERIYFNIDYNTLPLFSSLMIRLKLIHLKENQQDIKELEHIGWSSFRLFNHNKQLRTGTHKISFYKYPISQGIIYGSFESYCNNSSSISFELDSYNSHIVYDEIESKHNKAVNIDSIIINKNDRKRLEKIMHTTPFSILDNYDKDIIWRNRYYLTQYPNMFIKIFQCIDYKNRAHLIELEKLLSNSKCINMIHSLHLLTGDYYHPSIRKYAVKCLEECSPTDVEGFLIQLVQGLKYEMFHESYLADYLLRLAISYPLTIGHSFFWNLKSEINNIYYKQRFGLYLEVFLTKIGKKILKAYENEVSFIRALQSISDIPKDTTVENTERKYLLANAIEKLHNTIVNEFKKVSIPYDFKLRIKGIKVNQCRSMKSKKKPLWLVFENSDSQGEDVVILYKAGDDLRMDIITLQLFRIMQSIWNENKLRLKMTIYNVVCTGNYQGIVEIVKNAETLAQIHIKEGGAMQSFNKNAVKRWLNDCSTCSKEEVAENFLFTCVAYCVATFVVGIGDRHNDNIMIKHNGELFHIDFGHFLGHFKYKMGIKRERAPFVFTKQFQSILENEPKYNFALFKRKFAEAYQLLRKNCDRLVIVLQFLLYTGIPELTEKSIKFIEASLCLNDNSREAKRYLESQLDESLSSLSVELNFWIHIIANK